APLPGGQNVLNNTPTKNTLNSYSGRIDHSFGTRDFIYGRVSHYNEPFTAATSNPNELNDSLINGWNNTVHEVHTFGPRSIAEVFFGRNIGTLTASLQYPNVPKDFANTLISNGFSSNFLSGFLGSQSTLIPHIGISGYIGDSGVSEDVHEFSNTYEFGGSYTHIVGRHTVKVGAVISTNNFDRPTSQAGAQADVPQTGNLESPKNTGDALASFLLGVPTSAIRIGDHKILEHGWVDGAYAQDQIQVRPNLTVNVGLRYDLAKWPVLSESGSSNGIAGNMNLNTGNYEINAAPPACSSTQGAPCIPGGTLPAHVILAPYGNRSLHATDYKNWSWRFGTAYHPWPKTSLLVGYGRYYDEWASVVQMVDQYGGTWPAVEAQQLTRINATTVTNPLTDPLLMGSTQTTTPPTPFQTSGYYSNPNLKQPYSDQWNAGIEQGFGANTILTLTYVGATGRRLTQGFIGNAATSPAPGPITARQPYPYSLPSKYFTDRGESNYQALQASLHHTTGNGLTYLLSYTWSKSIDNGCSGSFISEDCDIQNPYDSASVRSVSGFDVPQILSASVVYSLPFGQGRQFYFHHSVANFVAGGWSMGMQTGYTSGRPLTPHVNGDSANIGGTFVLPNVVSNPIPSHQTARKWFDPTSLQAPAPYTFGDYPRNSIRGPHHLGAVDLSIFKLFPIYRDSSLEFRADSFNVFNHPVLGDPNISFGNKAFGTITGTAGGPRTMQLALKLHF
ncbi:MAG: TonB-dependent receptor, partial [Edaphobacter sp.]